MNKTSRRGILAGAVTMAAIATVGTQTASAETGVDDVTRILGETGRTYRLVSGVLRNTGGGWAWINDAGHRASGFRAATQTSTAITLPYSFRGLKVSSLQVTPDEYFASRGLRVGASVGLDKTVLTLYTEDACEIGDYVYYNAATAKWVSLNGVFTGMTYANGALTLTHQSMGTGKGMYASASARGQALALVGSLGDTTTQVTFHTGSFGSLAPAGAPNASQHRVWVSRHGVRTTPPANPASVAAANGNLWVTGLIEVA